MILAMDFEIKTPSLSFRHQDLSTELDPKILDTIIISGWLIGKAERTKKTYKKVIKSFFEYHPRINIQTTTPAHITMYLKESENRQVRSTTLNLYLNALSSLFRFAVKQRRITQDPTQGLKNYRIQNTVYQKILYIDQIQQMLLKTKRERDLLLIKMLYYIGLRVSEVTEILVSDFTFRKDGVILNIKGKGSKIRQAPLGEDLWLEIENYIQLQDLRPSDHLFSNEIAKSTKLSTFAIWRAVRASAKRAKINPMPSPHWFRHTCATMSLEGGAPIHVVKERLGHASLSTTQIYLHAKASEGLSQYLPKIK
jgi:integrase/recombinase XerD